MRSWHRGAGVRFQSDEGEVIPGQVWAEADLDGMVWLALDDGRFARVRVDTGRGELCSATGRPAGVAGKVAA